MKLIAKDLVKKNGMSFNDVLDMPLDFFVETMKEKKQSFAPVRSEEQTERILDNM